MCGLINLMRNLGAFHLQIANQKKITSKLLKSLNSTKFYTLGLSYSSRKAKIKCKWASCSKCLELLLLLLTVCPRTWAGPRPLSKPVLLEAFFCGRTRSLLGPFSFHLLLVSQSPFHTCLFTGSFFLLLRLFSFELVPSPRALQVRKPRSCFHHCLHWEPFTKQLRLE